MGSTRMHEVDRSLEGNPLDVCVNAYLVCKHFLHINGEIPYKSAGVRGQQTAGCTF